MKALAEQINELDGVEIYGRVVGVRVMRTMDINLRWAW